MTTVEKLLVNREQNQIKVDAIKKLTEKIKDKNSDVKSILNGTWVCNHCGSHNISCSYTAEVTGTAKPNMIGTINNDDINIDNINYVNTNLYWCEDCKKQFTNIHELAHWDSLK